MQGGAGGKQAAESGAADQSGKNEQQCQSWRISLGRVEPVCEQIAHRLDASHWFGEAMPANRTVQRSARQSIRIVRTLLQKPNYQGTAKPPMPRSLGLKVLSVAPNVPYGRSLLFVRRTSWRP